MAEKAWEEIEENSNIFGIKLLFAVYKLLGRGVFRVVLVPVIIYYFLTNSLARRSSLTFLAKVREFNGIPEKGWLVVWSVKHFLAFGTNLLDQLAAWTNRDIVRTTAVFGREAFLANSKKGRGALVITAHIGNLEASRALASFDNLKSFNVLVHTKHAEKLNRLKSENDERSGMNLIQVTELSPATAVMLDEKLKNNEVIVIAGDRTPVGGGNRQTRAMFLGEEAIFPQGPYILASILKCPVYLLFNVRDGNEFKLFFEPFADSIHLGRKQRDRDIAGWTQKYADRLEEYAVKYPLQWANFYDFWRKAPVDNDALKKGP